MSTVQIAAIVAAFAVVLIIVVVLLVRAGRHDGIEPEVRAEGSMFDQPPSDTLAKLGKAEHQPETADVAEVDETGLGAPVAPEPAATTPETEAAGGASAAGLESMPDDGQTQPAEAAEVTPEPAVTEQPPEPATGEPEMQEPAAQGHLIPLSSIIVTTSNKIVDLDDPEIRHMLTDLVTFEIDQAEQYREQGQNIDAVLQLTEAEKICRALGKEDTAGEIRAMMRALQA